MMSFGRSSKRCFDCLLFLWLLTKSFSISASTEFPAKKVYFVKIDRQLEKGVRVKNFARNDPVQNEGRNVLFVCFLLIGGNSDIEHQMKKQLPAFLVFHWPTGAFKYDIILNQWLKIQEIRCGSA